MHNLTIKTVFNYTAVSFFLSKDTVSYTALKSLNKARKEITLEALV